MLSRCTTVLLMPLLSALPSGGERIFYFYSHVVMTSFSCFHILIFFELFVPLDANCTCKTFLCLNHDFACIAGFPDAFDLIFVCPFQMLLSCF